MTCVLGTAVTVLILDIATKTAALHSLRPFAPIKIIPGFFDLSLVFNRGAAFGIFPGGAKIFLVFAVITLAILLIFSARLKSGSIGLKVALGLICGGTLGNLLDRLRFGHVIDFLDFYVAGWHWPAFNVADSCLCVGAGMLLLQALRKHPPSGQN